MINRNIFNKLQQELTRPEILILLGPRQVGKTTLLKMLQDYAKKNLGNELKKSCKTYLYDLGVRNALLKDFSGSDRKDYGMVLESFVFLRLQAGLKPNMEIKFWRTKDGGEVDFILLKDRKPFPIEVKATVEKSEIPSGIKRFLNRYPEVQTAYVINGTVNDQINFGECRIHYLTFDRFSENFNI